MKDNRRKQGAEGMSILLLCGIEICIYVTLTFHDLSDFIANYNK